MARTLIIRKGGLSHQHHITTLMSYLVDRNLDFTFLSLGSEPEALRNFVAATGVVTRRLTDGQENSWIKQLFADALAIKRALKSEKYDNLYVIDSWSLPAVFLARYLFFAAFPKRWIYHTFDMLTKTGHGRVYFNLESWFAKSAAEILVTDPSRAAIFRHAHQIEKRVHSLPIRMQSDAKLPARDAAVRESILGSRHGDLRLLVYPTAVAASRCSFEVIRSLKALPDDFHLVTFEGDKGATDEARRLAAEAGVEKRLHILARMPFDEMLKIVASADLGMIFHDANSGLGNFFSHPGRLAYLIALGLPIVGTAVPSLEATIYKFGLGNCCDPQNSEEIAKAVEKTIDRTGTSDKSAQGLRRELAFEHMADKVFDQILFAGEDKA